MADVNKEIALKVTTDVGQTTQQFKSATEELKKTQKSLVEMALAGKQGTKEFREMEARAGQLRDAIGDVRQRVNALASDTPKLDLLTGAAQGIAGGFAAAQGAAALFGSENEEVQQAILKTQGAMALLNGVQQVANTLNKDSAFMTQANAMAQRAYGVAVGTSTGALKLFRLALIATGIGAAVVAVGMLVANWDKLTSAIMKFVNESPVLTKILDFITSKFQKLGQALGFLATAAEKSLEVQIEVFEKQKRLLEAQGKDTTEIERAILQRKLELAKEHNKDVEKAQEELQLFEEKILFKRNQAIKAANEKALKERQAAIEKAREEDKKELEALNEHLRQMEVSRMKAERIRQENEEAANVVRMQAEAQRRLKIQAEQEKFNAIKLADENFLQDQMYQLTANSFQAIADLSAFFAGQSEEGQERAFKIQKAMNIAKTLVETYSAAQSAYASQLTIPDPSAPIRAAVAAGIAIAAGLARVAAIRNTNFNRASTGVVAGIRPAGYSSGGGTPLAFNPNQSTPINPMQTNTNSTGQQGAQRVYVLERDISSVGRKVRNVENFATFGN
jgi:hypothetical protein